ncbi:hypothetical protein MAPG_04805 [Magnaporthiopsis poae ATCC 64411]|uniref:PD-(D/E)XK nuclease-like domain-containing protein n=1 Tax=Magnaporthiopsis poae (strain ATCC 64411 / 73-15) TaxID=644358 RepID=A0A0C4DXQ1_MAGP6|nr:hypothetical protein MAPG_04805 [Magnaporthiopsis poae ATCC 64411]
MEASRILSWLDACEPQLAPPPGSVAVPPTPPVSTSPSKRKRSRKSDGRGDGQSMLEPDREGRQGTTPRRRWQRRQERHRRRVQAVTASSRIRPAPASSASVPSASGSESSRPSRRSTSPVKHVFHLKLLAKPVEFTAVSGDPLSRLPDDVHDLFSKINRIVEYREAFIPDASRECLARLLPDLPALATTRTDEDPSWLAWRQHDAFLAIQQEALQCQRQGRGELAWNTLVHSQVLRLAAGSITGGVACEPIVSASIAGQWLPDLAQQSAAASVKEVASGKMVDFALVLDLFDPLPEHATLAKSLMHTLSRLPSGAQSINQTMYEPLMLKPIGVSIETKVAASAGNTGSVQLGIWVAAWHRRITELLDVAPGGIITLPLVLCHGHEWNLHFACDRGERIEMVGPISSGKTSDVVSLYSLHETLRELCGWVGGNPEARDGGGDLWIQPVELPHS